MPTTDITGRIKTIVGLDNADCATLQGDGIMTQDDLSFVQFEDLNAGLTIVKRRKLDLIGRYLAVEENELNATTSINDIRRSVTMREQPTAASADRFDSGAPKLYTDPLSEFSGDPIDFEEWEGKSRATIRQTVFREHLDRVADPTKPQEVARDSHLYNMILSAVRKGHAHSRVEKLKDEPGIGESGYHAWKTLSEWYLDPSQKSLMLNHYSTKLDALFLDDNTSATEYINKFDLYVRKIEKLDGLWSEEKRLREFLKRVTSQDYDVEKRVHNKSTFKDLVKAFRKREQDLENEEITDKVTRRFKKNDTSTDVEDVSSDKDSDAGKSKSKKKEFNIPFIPGFLFKSLDKAAKRNVKKWREMTNSGKFMAQSDMFTEVENDKSDKNKNTPPSGKGKQKNKKGKTQRRLTTMVASGVPDDTVEVKLDTDDEQYSYFDFNKSCFILPRRYDSESLSKLDHSKQDAKIIRRNVSVGISRGRSTEPPYAVIDPGATEDLIGCVGWHIVHISQRHEVLRGAIDGMGTIALPKVDAITSVTDVKGNVHLLGFGNVTHDSRKKQHEPLLNSHHMRNNGVKVNDVAKKHGGEQNLELKINGRIIRIPLIFDGDIMKLDLREPTEEELTTLGVVWITPAIMNYTAQSIRRERVRNDIFPIQIPGMRDPVPEEEVDVQTQTTPNNEVMYGNDVGLKHWKELLGFPSNEVVEKTLESTTQLCAEPVEMERRELPRQHRKKRLLPLHPRRLRGRTDSDTFFSSLKSIRGFTCVQLFVHVSSDYLFVKCMKREAHSHGAYQDFIREIGAPSVLITDNSRTQTGENWQSTSRGIMTKQRKFAPHNQNQNKAERRIQDAKHKTMQVMGRSNAPLKFWCYALIHVIDCLNHLAKNSLNSRTSYELLNGDTPDISAFRFTFWQPIEYFDPTAKFPDSLWKKGRFLGIAWDSGDQFTFRIWIDHDDDYNNGRELIRNIVRPRKSILSSKEQECSEKSDLSTFKFQKMVATRKRKRGKRSITSYKLQDLDAFDEHKEEQVGDNADEYADQFYEHPLVLGSDNDINQEEVGENDTNPVLVEQREHTPASTHNQPQSKILTQMLPMLEFQV